MKNENFSPRARLRSFKYALEGVASFFASEPNALLHLLATITVAILVCIVPVSRMELITLVIVIGGVWCAEIFNTALEKIMDHLSPGEHPAVKYIKDLAAAAVLVSATTALITGLIIFIPKLFLK